MRPIIAAACDGVGMRGAWLTKYKAKLCACLLLFVGSVAGRQASPEPTSTHKPASSGSTSLRICLRLQDDSLFSGSANVRVLPSEGYEVAGTMESEGEMLFPDVPPGTYTVET